MKSVFIDDSMLSPATLIDRVYADIARDQVRLPTLPNVAMGIIEELEDGETTFRRLSDKIQTDTGLTARLVQIANSPLYRTVEPVLDLHSAILRIGLSMLPALATSLLVEQMFCSDTPEIDKYLKQQWKRNTEVAKTAQEIASKQAPHLKPQTVYLAGLLHDIGMLPLLAVIRKDDVLNYGLQPFLDAAYLMHTDIGGKLLKAWRFPAVFVEVASEHHGLLPETLENLDYVGVTKLALHSLGEGHQENPV